MHDLQKAKITDKTFLDDHRDINKLLANNTGNDNPIKDDIGAHNLPFSCVPTAGGRVFTRDSKQTKDNKSPNILLSLIALIRPPVWPANLNHVHLTTCVELPTAAFLTSVGGCSAPLPLRQFSTAMLASAPRTFCITVIEGEAISLPKPTR